MRTVCITVTDPTYGKASPHIERTRTHFAERGVDAQMFYGIHAQRIGVNAVVVSAAIAASDPDKTQTIGMMPTGCWLSHRALWAALLLPDEPTMVLESDASFPADWRERFDRALADVQQGDPEWEILFPGSCCCCQGQKQRHLVGDVFAVEAGPQCSHAYVIRSHAVAKRLCERVDEKGLILPIDSLLALHVLPSLRSYVVLPRIVDQFETLLPP